MQPDLSYLYAVPVKGIKATETEYEIDMESGARITIYGENVEPDVTGLTLLTTFKPTADKTTMRFGSTVKEDGGGYAVVNQTDIEIFSINYTVADPRWPDAGEYAPEAVVAPSEPDPVAEQWNADRTQEGPENPS